MDLPRNDLPPPSYDKFAGWFMVIAIAVLVILHMIGVIWLDAQDFDRFHRSMLQMQADYAIVKQEFRELQDEMAELKDEVAELRKSLIEATESVDTAPE